MVQRIQTFDIPGGGITHCTQNEFDKILKLLGSVDMIRTITKYVASDGTEFLTKTEALQHDQNDSEKLAKNLNQYLYVSYAGAQLLKKHLLSEEGVWHVRGEDPNCDMGGSHHKPSLGYYEGTLDEVVRMAVMLPGFWQWGGGGTIEKAIPPNVIKLGV